MTMTANQRAVQADALRAFGPVMPVVVDGAIPAQYAEAEHSLLLRNRYVPQTIIMGTYNRTNDRVECDVLVLTDGRRTVTDDGAPETVHVSAALEVYP